MSSIVLLNESCVDRNVDAIVNAANKDLMCAERILLHSISFSLISSGIYGGDLENPVAESIKQCLLAYKKFTSDYPDYQIDVKVCLQSGINERSQTCI